MRKIAILILGFTVLQSCQVREEITFAKDGSGTYEMILDLSEMLDMGGLTDSIPSQTSMDTLVIFDNFLNSNMDSIQKLPRKQQRELETLRPLRYEIKSNDSLQEMSMHLTYSFHTVAEITRFPEALQLANIRALNTVLNPFEPTAGGEADSIPRDDGMSGLFSIAKSFRTSFSKSRFSRKITDKARVEALQKKDPTLKDDSFGDMIHFKQVYHFPYRVGAVSNPNARILPDFMGVEIEATIVQMNQDPDYFNIVVDFGE